MNQKTITIPETGLWNFEQTFRFELGILSVISLRINYPEKYEAIMAILAGPKIR